MVVPRSIQRNLLWPTHFTHVPFQLGYALENEASPYWAPLAGSVWTQEDLVELTCPIGGLESVELSNTLPGG